MRARTLIRQHGWVDAKIPNERNFQEVYDWCKSTIDKNAYLIRTAPRKRYDDVEYKIVFKNPTDATLFQLTWG